MTKNQSKAEKYLKKIKEIEKNVKDKQDELEALRYKASGAGAIRYDKDHVQTSPKDYLAMAMDDIIEIEKQLEEDKASIESMKGEAYCIVRRIDKIDHRTLIEWFYLNDMTMPETAKKMNMSERNAYYLKDDALESFGAKM